MRLLAYLEDSAVSEWLSISMLGFPSLIALHSVGMAAAVGISLMVTLRLHGMLVEFDYGFVPKLLRVAVWGFTLNLVTGVALFITRATDYITSYMFLTKMLLVLVSAAILFWLQLRIRTHNEAATAPEADRLVRSMSLIATTTWFGAVITGRLIAYLSQIYR